MRFDIRSILTFIGVACLVTAQGSHGYSQSPLLKSNNGKIINSNSNSNNITLELFAELEELARIVDITYCVGLTSFGITKPFQCLSRCSQFPQFELVKTFNTGPLLSDSCGYIALDHGQERIIVAFRGTHSIPNTIIDLSTVPQEYVPYPPDDDDDGENKVLWTTDGLEPERPKCRNCTVHMGFNLAWRSTRAAIIPDLVEQIRMFPRYKLHLVGHSLGGAVAALGGLELFTRGWNPIVTTFGEPRIGNRGLAQYLDEVFNLKHGNDTSSSQQLKYRRLTHVDDLIPLLPLTEWGFAMHAGEIFISKPSLSPDVQDLNYCKGDIDFDCIAGQDSSIIKDPGFDTDVQRSDLRLSVMNEIHDVVNEPWGIPSRYKLWQLFFAHRDYFWRLGLCVPGGDPMGGGRTSPDVS